MDEKIQHVVPDYKRIYTDIINRKNPRIRENCKSLLEKTELTVLGILELNRRIFGTSSKENEMSNQKFRSYKESDILHILEYQKTHQLNNIQVANHFKTSRNTIAKWRKIFTNEFAVIKN